MKGSAALKYVCSSVQGMFKVLIKAGDCMPYQRMNKNETMIKYYEESENPDMMSGDMFMEEMEDEEEVHEMEEEMEENVEEEMEEEMDKEMEENYNVRKEEEKWVKETKGKKNNDKREKAKGRKGRAKQEKRDKKKKN